MHAHKSTGHVPHNTAETNRASGSGRALRGVCCKASATFVTPQLTNWLRGAPGGGVVPQLDAVSASTSCSTARGKAAEVPPQPKYDMIRCKPSAHVAATRTSVSQAACTGVGPTAGVAAAPASPGVAVPVTLGLACSCALASASWVAVQRRWRCRGVRQCFAHTPASTDVAATQAAYAHRPRCCRWIQEHTVHTQHDFASPAHPTTPP